MTKDSRAKASAKPKSKPAGATKSAPKSPGKLRVSRGAFKLRQFLCDAHGPAPAVVRKSTAGERADDTFNGMKTLILHGFGKSEMHDDRAVKSRRNTLHFKFKQALAPGSKVREVLQNKDAVLLRMLDALHAELDASVAEEATKGKVYRHNYSAEWKAYMSSDGGVLSNERLKLIEAAAKAAGIWEGADAHDAAERRRQSAMETLKQASKVAEAVQAAEDAANLKIAELQKELAAEKEKTAQLKASNDRLERALKQAQAGAYSSSSMPVYGGSLVIAPQ